MKRLSLALILVMLMLVPSLVNAQGIDDPGGIPLYVIIEVNWDPATSPKGDWTVYGPVFEPVLGGTPLTSCTNCLEMNYDFVFRGKTLQFDEVFVPTVEATPQVKHIVLHDNDGDGVYTGSNSAHHYFPWVEGSALLYFDRLDYTVVTNGGSVTHFSYLQYEHKKLIPAEG